MARMKTFFIYLLLVIAFFIFSQIIIYIAINTTYEFKNVEIKQPIIKEAEVQATSINGFAKVKLVNEQDSELESKYIKVECYSKHNVLMGTKYIEIGRIKAKEEREFEVRFNYSKVDKAIISIVDKKVLDEQNVPQEEKLSDPERGLATMIAALILLYYI